MTARSPPRAARTHGAPAIYEWQTDAHLWAALVGQTLFALTPFALARALWPSPVGAAALLAGLFGLVFGTGTAFLESADSLPGGLFQRVGLGVLHLWVFIVAAGVLYETSREPPPGKLVPLRPRDFFATAWEGMANLLRPFFLGRFFAQRYSTARTSIGSGSRCSGSTTRPALAKAAPSGARPTASSSPRTTCD